MNPNATQMTLFFCLCISLFTIEAPLLANDTDKHQNATTKVSLFPYLYSVARPLNCYFTTESFSPETNQTDLELLSVDDVPVKTVPELIVKLNKELKGIRVLQDAHNPKIIHLIAKSLMNAPDYALTRQGSLVYSGTLNGVPDDLGKRLGVALETRSGFPVPTPPIDYFTQVSFTATNQEVRSILTDYVPLKNYSRYLWTAGSLRYKGRLITYVFYTGPLRQKAK